MGRQASPELLFYDFSLDGCVPSDHLLRKIDVFRDLETIRRELKSFYSSIGHPGIGDPDADCWLLILCSL